MMDGGCGTTFAALNVMPPYSRVQVLFGLLPRDQRPAGVLFDGLFENAKIFEVFDTLAERDHFAVKAFER